MKILFFIFCFLNLYAPFSTNISFAFNVLLFCYVCLKRSPRLFESVFIYIPITLLLVSVTAFLYTRDPIQETSSFGIYARMFVNCTIFPTIIAFFYRKNTRFFSILSITLLLHCLVILIQILFPQIQELNKLLFRFDRDNLDMADYSLRRLGLSGGYDHSAFYAVLSCLFSSILYIQTKRKQYITFLIISFVASLFTSRTGMVVSVLTLLIVAMINRRALKVKLNLTSLFLIIVVTIVSMYYILPVVLNSFGISYGNVMVETEMQYSSKTADYLFDYHLYPLLTLTNNELLWGYGCEVNKSALQSFSSDIGYVKQIFQVGVIGVSLIIIFCFLMAQRTSRRYKRLNYDNILKTCSQLMWILFLLYIIFNYKNHIMYTICYFEVFLFVYYYAYYHYIYNNLHRRKP